MRRAWLAALGLLVACALPDGGLFVPPDSLRQGPVPGPPPPLDQAQLSVEVWTGDRQSPASDARPPDHVELVIDLTTSMQAKEGEGPPRYMAARESAARLLRALPADTSVGVRAVGISTGSACVAPTRIAQGSAAGLGRGVQGHLRALRPQSEGSLSAALESVLHHHVGPLEQTRVVLFTDLGSECGADLCAAGRALAREGARIELVLFGGSEPPACLADFVPGRLPRIADKALVAPRPTFHVELHDVESPRRGRVVANGVADGTTVILPPVPVLLRVEMNPLALIGPIQLHPNGHTRVRILDFPSLDPPVREWGWDTVPADGAVALRPEAPDARVAHR